MKMAKLSSRDIVMIVLVGLILASVLYYMGFYKPYQTELADLTAQAAAVDDEIEVAIAKDAQMKKMQEELNVILSQPKFQITEIAPYDNKNVVLNMLNGILGRSLQYSLSFTDPSINNDGTVRRDVSMEFTCKDYESAKIIIRDLTKSTWRCMVRNCSITDNGPYEDETEEVHPAPVVSVDEEDKDKGANIMENSVSVSATITFFESTQLTKE